MLQRSLGFLAVLVACQAGINDAGGGGANPTGGAGGTGAGGEAPIGAGTPSGGGGSGAGFATGGMGGNGGGPIQCTPLGPDDDVDADGFTPNQGDCEDCDPARNPNAIEAPTAPNGRPFDEDCDDQIDEVEEQVLCDADIAIDELDPIAAALAIELCKTSAGPNDWGLVGAKWVMADGAPPPVDGAALANFHRGHGFLDDFGPNVSTRAGERMLVVSSGTARRPEDPGYEDVGGFPKGYNGGFAQGFPKEAPFCPGITTGTPFDPTGVELEIRTPSNATGFSFDFNFYTYEWPIYVCSQFNDFFLAILDPIPEGQTDGNISFDSVGNPISVNNALVQVCGCPNNPPQPCQAGPLSFPCPLGNTELIGTGFGFDTAFNDHAATSWLQTTAPAPANAIIKLRFAVHDSGDGSLDSTTLVDNFRWTAAPGTQVGTNPVPQ
jgi:hypothetical protein